MDNKLNEIRRKIRFLRAEMLGAEDNVRKRVNRGEDCAEGAMHVMAMRVVITADDGLPRREPEALERGARTP